MLLDFKHMISKYDLKINGVIHIGGHHGQETKLYHECGITDIIYFEPQPDKAKICRENNQNDKDTKVVEYALGASNKDHMAMYVETANMGQSSSLLKPKKHLEIRPDIQFNDMIYVQQRKLDCFVDIPEHYNFINIDVQGYELEVFKGATKRLENIDYIISEVNYDEAYEGCPLVGDIDEHLATYGFKRVAISDESPCWNDALYIKG